MPTSAKERMQQKLKDKKEKEEKAQKEEEKELEKINENSLWINRHKSKYISLRFGDFVNLNFDKLTGKSISITDTKESGPIPKEIDWLSIQDILMKPNANNNMNKKLFSSNEIGGIAAFKPDEILADYCPDAVSFIMMEKINEADRLKINIIITLQIDGTYIKKQDILDVIYVNIKSFWVILKHEVGTCRLVYFYKPDYNALGIESDSEEFSYTDTIINHTFICSIWTTFNITPSVIYIITYDESYQILILQFTVANYNSLFPEIILYSDINKYLYDKGQYLGFCANNNISAFTVILKTSNTEKSFYTGILGIKNPDVNKNTDIRLEFTDEHKLHPNLNLLQSLNLITRNMKETELYIVKCTMLENKEIYKKKQLNQAYKELEKREKLAEENLKKILEEEEAVKEAAKEAEKEKKEKEEKQKMIDFTKKQKIEEAIRIAKEAESIRMIMYDDVMDKVTEPVIEPVTEPVIEPVTEPVIEPVIDTTTIDNALDNALDSLMYKIINNMILKTIKLIYKNDIKTKIHNTITKTIDPIYLNMHKPQALELVPDSLRVRDIFMHNMYLCYPSIAYALQNAPTKDIYLTILINERDAIMNIIDNLVITHPYILKIKSIIDGKISNKIDISAIYGSYLSIIYSLVLNSIGLQYNPFSKYENPLYEVDIDTMSISFMSDEDMSYGYDFTCEKPTIIAYHTDIQPIQNTKIKTSSIDTLLNNCWDINSTSAILLFEKNNEPHIMRNPDFTEFLFGIQPIKVIFGKNQYNLYNLELTEKRLIKAYTKWY